MYNILYTKLHEKKEEEKEKKQGGKNKCNFVLLFPHTSSITQVCV